VRKSISYTETEAVRDSVVDLIAGSTEALLDSIHDREVRVNDQAKRLKTQGATIKEIEMPWKFKILNTLSDPNIAYIFLLLGIYGLMFELYNPGAILPGVVGVISIILAFYSLHTLPVNYAGLALIVVGIVLFILEVKITSYGLLTIGGVIAFFLGSIMLIDTGSPLELVSLSWSVIIPAVLVTAGFFIFAIGMGIRAQRKKPTTGVEGIVGEVGEAIADLNPDGQVSVHGEIWNATSASGRIKKGTKIAVESIHNLQLTVRRAD
jgi:membrane-bound serine protease (ClpP class)